MTWKLKYWYRIFYTDSGEYAGMCPHHVMAAHVYVIGHGNEIRYSYEFISYEFISRLWRVSPRQDAGVSKDRPVCHHPISTRQYNYHGYGGNRQQRHPC